MEPRDLNPCSRRPAGDARKTLAYLPWRKAVAHSSLAATVPAYVVQRCCSARGRKNYQNRQIECAGSTNHSFHSRGRNRTGYLGSECAGVRCGNPEGIRRQEENRVV